MTRALFCKFSCKLFLFLKVSYLSSGLTGAEGDALVLDERKFYSLVINPV